jgi:tetratricopeptide (TPR) repeat protein
MCRRLQVLAESAPQRAVPLARRAVDATAADPHTQAWARYTLGWALLCWERFDDARPELQAAQAAFAAQGVHMATLRCRHALLLADLAQFARADLEQEFAALAEACVLAGAPRLAASVSIDQARALYALGRASDAGALLDGIAASIEQCRPFDRARFLRIRGVVANMRSDQARAIELLTQAEQTFAALHSRGEVAKCWLERGWVALRQEQLDAAMEYYRRAERRFQRLDLPLQLAFCAKNIGLLLSRRGIYDLALRSLLTALHYFSQLRRIRDIGGCQLNLGNIYFYTARWEAALAYYTRAEALYTEAGVVGERLIAQRNRAMVCRAQRRFAEARALLLQVEAQAQAADDQTEVAEAWSMLAALLADTGDYIGAFSLYRQANELFTRLGNVVDAAECEVNQGWLELQHGRLEAAWAFFRSAALVIYPHAYYRWRVEYGLARCAEAYGEVEEALRHYRAASVTVASLRRRLASEEISSSLYAQAEQMHIDALCLAVDQGAVEVALEICEGQRALVLGRLLVVQATPLPAEYQEQHDTLRVEIASLLADGDAVEGAGAARLDAALSAYGDLLLQARHSTPLVPPPLNLPEPVFTLGPLRENLIAAYGADWAVLSYTLSGEMLFIGTITPEGATIERTPYDQRLQRLIAQATQPSYRRYTYLDLPLLQGESDRPWADLHELAARLLPDALRAQLHPQRRLLIVPAGPLHALPWAALRLDDSWLAEQAIVQIAPALSTWQTLASQPPIQATALLVGCSSFGERMPPLPAVGAELDAIAARWPGTYNQLRDTQATQAALLERTASGELAQYGLLHIASHARLLPARGRAAHLKLWDGDLLLSEIASLRLGGALVVLSACDGAAADALLGEEVLSLSWAFLAAGASAVLASLWPVEDSAVVWIMAAFYSALRQHGDAALALAQVQRELIAAYSEDDSVTGPTGWGSFVLTGASHFAEKGR